MAKSAQFFDVARMHSAFVAERVRTVSVADLVAQGGKVVAKWSVDLDPTAQLARLERIVREDSLGKAFGDGEVFALIPDSKNVQLTFVKLEDGSGAVVASWNGENADIKALLSKLRIDELDLNARFPAEKKAEAPKAAVLVVAGQELQVEVKADEAPSKRRRYGAHQMAFHVQVPSHNEIALRDFLISTWSAEANALPMPDASDLHVAAMLHFAGSHPDDDAWADGVSVVDMATEEAIASPAAASKRFAAALEEREGPVIDRDELLAKFRAARGM